MAVFHAAGVLFTWIASPILRKYVLRVITPEQFTFLLAITCAFVASIFFIVYRERNFELNMPPRLLLIVLVLSIFSTGGGFLLSTLIKEHDNPGEVMAVLNALTTVGTYVLSIVLFDAVWTWGKMGGICLIAAGLTLMY